MTVRPLTESEVREAMMHDLLSRAELSTQDINDLPDSDFAYIESGGTKDAEGKTTPRSLRHFPIQDADHVRDALSRAPQSPFGKDAMPKILKAAKRFGVEAADDDEPDGDADDYKRSAPYDPREILRYDRTWALDDIEIQRGGDGRTVEAYAAVFERPAEIKDQHGHYNEVISRSAFNRAISHGTDRVGVFYNHGLTIHGTPSELGSVPIGSPVSITADCKGLLTVTRYNKSQFADTVLEAIRNGDIKGYSFRGRIFQSTPDRVPRNRGGELPTITRTELGLSEYGPTHAPYYADAGIVAVRSVRELVNDFQNLSDEDRQDLLRVLGGNATPNQGPGAADPPQALRSAAELRRRARVALITRSM